MIIREKKRTNWFIPVIVALVAIIVLSGILYATVPSVRNFFSEDNHELRPLATGQSFYNIDPIQRGPSGFGSWEEVDLSDNVPANATGAIYHVYTPTSNRIVGARMHGSTDDYKNTLYGASHVWQIVGLDSSKHCDLYQGTDNSSVQWWLEGYVTDDGVIMLPNGIPCTPGTTGSWQETDLSASVPDNSTGVILQVYRSVNTAYDFGARMHGSTDNRVQENNVWNTPLVVIGCDENQTIDIYIENSNQKVYLMGYIFAGATFYTNATDLSLGTTGSYVTLSDNIPEGGYLGFIEVAASSAWNYSLREYGSSGTSDNIYAYVYKHTWAVVPCATENQLIEGKIANGVVDFFLVGYADNSTGSLAPPTIVDVTPATLAQSTSDELVITGTNFIGTAAVEFYTDNTHAVVDTENITVSSYSVDNSTQITVSVQAALDTPLGAHSFSITNGGGTVYSDNTFSVTAAPEPPEQYRALIAYDVSLYWLTDFSDDGQKAINAAKDAEVDTLIVLLNSLTADQLITYSGNVTNFVSECQAENISVWMGWNWPQVGYTPGDLVFEDDYQIYLDAVIDYNAANPAYMIEGLQFDLEISSHTTDQEVDFLEDMATFFTAAYAYNSGSDNISSENMTTCLFTDPNWGRTPQATPFADVVEQVDIIDVEHYWWDYPGSEYPDGIEWAVENDRNVVDIVCSKGKLFSATVNCEEIAQTADWGYTRMQFGKDNGEHSIFDAIDDLTTYYQVARRANFKGTTIYYSSESVAWWTIGSGATFPSGSYELGDNVDISIPIWWKLERHQRPMGIKFEVKDSNGTITDNSAINCLSDGQSINQALKVYIPGDAYPGAATTRVTVWCVSYTNSEDYDRIYYGSELSALGESARHAYLEALDMDTIVSEGFEGYRDPPILMYDSGWQSGVTINGEVPAPTVTTVAPNSGLQGQTENITLTGTYFDNATVVSFGTGVTTNSFSVDNSTQITAEITVSPSATTGLRNVSVTTPGGTGTKTNGFTVNAGVPTITLINPNTELQGQTESVVITGTYFTGATVVSFGTGITTNSFTVDNSTQITASITISETATTGVRTVSVTAPGGTADSVGGFTINPGVPVVDSVTPDYGYRGDDNTSIVITGHYFTGTTLVSFGLGTTVENFTITSSIRLDVKVSIADNATFGYRTVSVTTPGGTDDEGNAFEVITGVVSSTSPNWGLIGDDNITVVINGTHLTGSTVVSFGAGITVENFTVISGIRIDAIISIADDATEGWRDVTVTVPTETITGSSKFRVYEVSPVGTLEDSVNDLARVAIYVFVGICILGVLALMTTEFSVATIILAGIAIVVTIVGVELMLQVLA